MAAKITKVESWKPGSIAAQLHVWVCKTGLGLGVGSSGFRL